MIFVENPNEEIAKRVKESVNKNGGYCPCALVKNEDTLCPCKEFREGEELGPCKCGRYIKKEIYNGKA